ncbi:MAG: hypothetical protein QOD93_5379 [Acetobacteraceae bacterium]|jgi:hypothetical protein|nr:hypothetical protein [Acetobacteraceae bacterium]
MLFLISCDCGVDHLGRSLRRPGREYRLRVLIKVIQDVSMSGGAAAPAARRTACQARIASAEALHPPSRDALYILKSSLA